mgnify:CR=1 FL=1
MQWWEINIPSLRLSRRLADQTVPISHPPPLPSLSPLRFPHGWVPKPQTWTHIASLLGRGGGVPYRRVCRGWGGSEGDRVTWRRHLHHHRTQVYLPAPSPLLRSVHSCGVIPGHRALLGCKVLILASTAAAMTPPLLALAHPCQRPAPAPPLPPPADYRPLQRGDLGQIGVGELTLPPLHTLLRFGLHLMCVHVSWIHAIFDVVVVLVLFSTISLFSPLLLSSVI